MNTTRELLTELQSMGVELRAVGDKIKVRAPAGKVTTALRDRLTDAKPELLKLLTANKLQQSPHNNVIDIRAYLAKLCRRLPMPPEHLLYHYFTDDDLADIAAGKFPDPYALGKFIETDPRYPFGCFDEGVRNDKD